MNRIAGFIEEIRSDEGISLVEVKTDIGTFYILVFDDPVKNDYLRTGNKINLIFKETEVAVVKGDITGSSFLNYFEGVIRSIKKGGIMVFLELQIKDISIFSVITRMSLERMDIKEGDKIGILLNPADISIEKTV